MNEWLYDDDKRFILAFSKHFWSEKKPEKIWHYCKYCAAKRPTFVLTEGFIGSSKKHQKLRCCYHCGAGLEILYQKKDVGSRYAVRKLPHERK